MIIKIIKIYKLKGILSLVTDSISYRGFINEKQFEGGTAEKQFIDLGKNNFGI